MDMTYKQEMGVGAMVLAGLVDRVAHLRFPRSSEETVVTLPFGFG